MTDQSTSTEYLNHEHDKRYQDVWEHMQRGLVYPSAHAIFASFWLNDYKAITRDELVKLKKEVRDNIHANKVSDQILAGLKARRVTLKNNKEPLGSKSSTMVMGAGVGLWKQICEDNQMNLPQGIAFKYPDESGNNSKVIAKSSNSFRNDQADLWFHIKSNDKQACEIILEMIKVALDGKYEKMIYQDAATKSTEPSGKGGKVIGSRFSENLNNPTDPISIAKHCLVGNEDIEHMGGSFVIAQRFKINWDQVHSMSEDQIEDMIGRKTDDTIIPNRDTRSHIKSARQQDSHGNTTPILRLGLPFGTSGYAACPHLASHGSNIADEAGIYFAGYAKSFPVLETIMRSQIGSVAAMTDADVDDSGGEDKTTQPPKGFMNDGIFNHIKSDLGGFFYIPSLADLGLDNEKSHESRWIGKAKLDWKTFPGMDWSRLDRHFDQSSDNGLMHYNHKEFLYRWSTMSAAERKKRNAPSMRILSLLENSFSRWQDNWYIDRKQEELDKITTYLEKFRKEYPHEPVPDDIMQETIMVRKGWSVRLTLHEMSSADYGFRGQKRKISDGKVVALHSAEDDGTGRIINGADTFRIQPEEIIVGGMPNLSLGEGRYAMLYLNEDERMDGFLANLSEASGVGHNIPDFEKVLHEGIDGLITYIDKHDTKDMPKDKKQFYESCRLSLKGVSEHAERYAALAEEMSLQMTAGQSWEKKNLLEIAARMRHIAHKPARILAEAAQLIYTMHSCLHLTGEPTALGRLDQVLLPFYKDDIAKKRINKGQAQEILDAFCIKLDEKVQSNRLFVEDHQPFGNLAMGGSAGPYPQGASINQWIMQVTVGGCDKDGKDAYNDLSTMFVRCISRMPLNAPCLSLRMTEGAPKEILDEAATALLTGGAHPIFLNDKLFIEGLKDSGNGVGNGFVNQDGKKNWNSQVSIESARNYACDGCYEPQFPGENWFSLGGFSTLEPLECALNRGKTYSSAGMSYFRGQVSSFTSRPAGEIDTFDDLLKLYFKHFKWLNRKRINGQLMGYGANTKFCPAPLLSTLIYDCVAKGLDYYSGGAKYNIYGPCYIGLSAAINSLYAIKVMVYDKKRAVTSLPELLDCLSCDWGYDMSEPFVSSISGTARVEAQADRYKRLREVALSLPRYGRGHAELDEFGNKIINRIADIAVKTFTDPLPQTGAKLAKLADDYGTEALPFGIQIQPGVGTFENHVEMGAWNGASADGRRKGTTIASDMSSMPSPADLPVEHQEAVFTEALKGYSLGDGTHCMTDGGPTDFNIPEDFPHDELVKVLKQFSQAQSSNILTVTVADPNTMEEAMTSPEQYDLLRVRTGGWTAYFTAMFPNIQEQHRRRPLSIPEPKK